MNQVLAVDLGGTKTAMALVDEAGRQTGKQKRASSSEVKGTIAQIEGCATGVPLRAIGVIVPGIYDSCTGEAWAPNLWGPHWTQLRDPVEQRLGVPVTIASDRAGYVLGEQWLGAARGLKDVIFVSVGTGIGAGILCDGRVIDGAHGIAGAVGWMVVGGPWTEEYQECGGWEFEAAGPAVARKAGTRGAEEVAVLARAGDRCALALMRHTADFLALGIANLISILDPAMVVLGGGLLQSGDLLFERIRENALRWTQPIAAHRTRIEMTILGEDAGLIGAARLDKIEG